MPASLVRSMTRRESSCLVHGSQVRCAASRMPSLLLPGLDHKESASVYATAGACKNAVELRRLRASSQFIVTTTSSASSLQHRSPTSNQHSCTNKDYRNTATVTPLNTMSPFAQTPDAAPPPNDDRVRQIEDVENLMQHLERLVEQKEGPLDKPSAILMYLFAAIVEEAKNGANPEKLAATMDEVENCFTSLWGDEEPKKEHNSEETERENERLKKGDARLKEDERMKAEAAKDPGKGPSLPWRSRRVAASQHEQGSWRRGGVDREKEIADLNEVIVDLRNQIFRLKAENSGFLQQIGVPKDKWFKD